MRSGIRRSKSQSKSRSVSPEETVEDIECSSASNKSSRRPQTFDAIRKKLKAARKANESKSKNKGNSNTDTSEERKRYRDQTSKNVGVRVRSKSRTRSRSRSRSKSRSRSRLNKTKNLNNALVDNRIAEIIGYTPQKSTTRSPYSGGKKSVQASPGSISNTQFYSSSFGDDDDDDFDRSQKYLHNLSSNITVDDNASRATSRGRVFSSFDSENSGRKNTKQGSRKSTRSARSRTPGAKREQENPSNGHSQPNNPPLRPHRRYRGFTSSIAALFQDEQIVCGAIACFGILLSQRTEHILNARNVRRGISKKRTPSSLLAYALAIVLLSVTITYSIWGITGIGANAQDYDDDYDSRNNYNRKLIMRGQFKVHEWHSLLWENSTLIESTRSLENIFNDDRYNIQYDDYEESNPGEIARACVILLFLFLLGVIGRRRRMRTRYEIIKARTQDDHLFYVEGEIDEVYDTREDKYEAACSHTLCGCYPADLEDEYDDDTIDDSIQTPVTFSSPPANAQNKDFVQKLFALLSNAFCGRCCRCWIQCFSVCALAQEAREARLLVPPKLQRVDYLTHQPFYEYHKRITDLRRRSIGGVINHAKSLSTLSKYLIFAFILFSLLITLTLLFNPRSAFGIGNLVVVLTTFGISFALLYILHWMIHRSDLGLDAVIKMFSAGFLIGVPTAFLFEALIINFSIFALYFCGGLLNIVKADGVITYIETHIRVMWSLSEIIQAFVVAALTEELCKYYTFRTIEHPDLMFITDDDRTKQIQKTSLASLYPVAPASSSDEDESFRGTKSRRRRAKNEDKRAQEIIEMIDDEPDERTPAQMAGAITVAMVSVALGLACAENFLYVFLLSDATVMQEGVILFFRSIFPVHALAAALQSIGVIKKYVEKDTEIGVGRIILSAVLMHGSFDASLMVLNGLQEETWNFFIDEYFETDYNVPLAISILAWLGVVCALGYGIYFYHKQSKEQKVRLLSIEEYYGYMNRGYEQSRNATPIQDNKKRLYTPPENGGAMA